MSGLLRVAVAGVVSLWAMTAAAETVGCATTAWKLLGANHRVCVEAFYDKKVPGVTCHVSQARKGGISGSLGLAQDPSQFSLACRQTGPISLPAKLPKKRPCLAKTLRCCLKKPAWSGCGMKKTGLWFISPSAVS